MTRERRGAGAGASPEPGRRGACGPGALAAHCAITAVKSWSTLTSKSLFRTVLRSECEILKPSSGMMPRSSGSTQ